MPRALARSHPFGMAPRPTNRSRQEPPRSCHLLCCSQYLSCGNIRTIVVAYVYKEQLGAIVWETIITCKWLLVSDKGISGQMFRKKSYSHMVACVSTRESWGRCLGSSHYMQMVLYLKKGTSGQMYGKQSLYAIGCLYAKEDISGQMFWEAVVICKWFLISQVDVFKLMCSLFCYFAPMSASNDASCT